MRALGSMDVLYKLGICEQQQSSKTAIAKVVANHKHSVHLNHIKDASQSFARLCVYIW